MTETRDTPMSKAQFDQELGYQSIISICHSMLKSGIIRNSDFIKAEQLFFEKYRPIYRSL